MPVSSWCRAPGRTPSAGAEAGRPRRRPARCPWLPPTWCPWLPPARCPWLPPARCPRLPPTWCPCLPPPGLTRPGPAAADDLVQRVERDLRRLAAGFLLVGEEDVDLSTDLLDAGFDSISLTE